MQALTHVLGEILAIALSVGIFAYFVGIVVRCRSCGHTFYFHQKRCPYCGSEYGASPDDDDVDHDQDKDVK